MSNPFDVYDLRYPSPPTLIKIATNKIVLELWRQEIHKHRIKGTLNQLNFEKSISSSTLQPYVPSSLLDIINQNISRVGTSIKVWVNCHTANQIFQTHVLLNFDDLVCYFDGSIDYGKTAKRIMHCDEISQVSKFKIACLCCLEEDIKLIWPSVSSQFQLRKMSFEDHPLLFYWICRLKNQLYKIPNYSNPTHDDFYDAFIMISDLITNYCKNPWPSVEYFFNRLNPSTRQDLLRNILPKLPQQYFRFVLAKLNEGELDEFLTTNRQERWHSRAILVIWSRVKDTTVDDFVNLVHWNLLYPVNFEIFIEIWINACDDFKQAAIQRVLLKDSLFRKRATYLTAGSDHFTNFLLIALSDASLLDRKRFWNANWVEILWMLNTSELHQIMTECFENEDEINRFRESALFDYRRIRKYFREAFVLGKLEKLYEFLNFSYNGEEIIRCIGLGLRNEIYYINNSFLEKADVFNKIINDTHNDIESANEFKKQIFLGPNLVTLFRNFVLHGLLSLVRKFTETLLPSEPSIKDYKENALLSAFKNCLIDGSYFVERTDGDFCNFVHWCLENDDEIAEFKATVPIDEVVHAVIRKEMQRARDNIPKMNREDRDPMAYNPKLTDFLKWYFVTSEAYINFKTKYAHDEDFVELTTQIEENVELPNL